MLAHNLARSPDLHGINKELGTTGHVYAGAHD